jgi:predicted tellurium resistance membrane protein TerC
MEALLRLVADPGSWLALLTLIVMEVVLGVDNLVFVAILTNKLPQAMRARARRIGIGLALGLRLALLATLSWIVGLTRPVVSLPWRPMPDAEGRLPFDLDFSWRDLILIAGGLFLVWKATKEIHHAVDPHPEEDVFTGRPATTSFAAAIVQILALDLVFSFDSILTAVGMTDQLPIMAAAVIVAVGLMLWASGPLAAFIARNPSVVMLALGFLLMIGTVLIADGFGVHVPKGYIYAAMAFAAFVEALNMLSRRRSAKDPNGA